MTKGVHAKRQKKDDQHVKTRFFFQPQHHLLEVQHQHFKTLLIWFQKMVPSNDMFCLLIDLKVCSTEIQLIQYYIIPLILKELGCQPLKIAQLDELANYTLKKINLDVQLRSPRHNCPERQKETSIMTWFDDISPSYSKSQNRA